MGQDSKIEWTHHTFNPWRGCTKVSAGCTNCYAETLSHRNPSVLGVWGPKGTRVIASESMWREPVKWDREAKAAGERRRVFCASLADVFEDRPELEQPRARLFRLIDDTPNLDWLLLTKRPENIGRMMPVPEMGSNYHVKGPIGALRLDVYRPNVWIGTSVENQATANERIPHLLNAPAKVRFLSVEPLLAHIDFFYGPQDWGLLTGINWVIVGGESGPDARRCDVAWIRGIAEQCKAANVSYFVKQLGTKPCSSNWSECNNPGPGGASGTRPLNLRDRKGGDPNEWPNDLLVRQFPEPR